MIFSWNWERGRQHQFNLSIVLIYISASLTNVQCLIIKTNTFPIRVPRQIKKISPDFNKTTGHPLVNPLMSEWPPQIFHINYSLWLMCCSFLEEREKEPGSHHAISSPWPYVCDKNRQLLMWALNQQVNLHILVYSDFNNDRE